MRRRVRDPLPHVENFYDADSASPILIFHYSGVASWREAHEDCRLEVVRRRLTGRLDLGFLSIPPVVVESNYHSLGIDHANCRIRQSVRNTGPRKRRTSRTE